MKANLTHGNSVTENYDPYAEPGARIAYALMDAVNMLGHALPIPRFKPGCPEGKIIGGVVIGESGIKHLILPK